MMMKKKFLNAVYDWVFYLLLLTVLFLFLVMVDTKLRVADPITTDKRSLMDEEIRNLYLYGNKTKPSKEEEL